MQSARIWSAIGGTSSKDISITHILFDQGKKLGEVSEWKMTPSDPVYKDVLGKRVLLPAKNDECSFVVPKPVNRKSQLTVIEDKKTELVLQIISVRGMTVVASIVARKKL